MQLTRRRVVALAIFTAAGCGGGSSTSAPTGIVFSLDWPQSRTLPRAAQSLRLRVSRNNTVLVERLFFPGAVTEAQILELPDLVPLVITADAFGTPEAGGSPLASSSLTLRLARGRVDRITLSLTSAITKVDLATELTESLWSLVATGRSQTNQVVLTSPAQWSWSLNSPTLGTLTPVGNSATFTPTGFGEAQISVTETESGKQATLVRGVTIGEPTTAAPTTATRLFSAPIVGLVALGSGSFACLRSGTLTGVRADGTTLWENRSDPDLLQLSGPYGSFLATQSPLGKVALYRTDTGSRFWQAALPSPTTGPPLFDGTDTLFFPESTPQIEARRLATGEVLWSAAVSGAPLYSDTNRIVAFDSASGILFAINTSFGAPLWQLLISGTPLYLGFRSGANPLLLLVIAGEVQALFASNGARLWSAALSASKGAVTSDKSLALVQNAAGLTALDTGTGATRWTRSGITSWLGTLPNDDLLVLPSTAPGESETVSALKASDGSVRWTAYLPSGSNTTSLLGTTVCVFSATRNQLYGIDAATGVYRWRYALTDSSSLAGGSGATVALLQNNQLTLLS